MVSNPDYAIFRVGGDWFLSIVEDFLPGDRFADLIGGELVVFRVVDEVHMPDDDGRRVYGLAVES